MSLTASKSGDINTKIETSGNPEDLDIIKALYTLIVNDRIAFE